MNYQCKNCGGNVVFNPKMKSMVCPYCDSTNSEDIKGSDIPSWYDIDRDALAKENRVYSMEAGAEDEKATYVCASCGGETEIGKFTSASRCPYCNNYLIIGKRISDGYRPSMILPFKIDKDGAVELLEKEFKKRIFTPSSFLTEKSLKDMNGRYVPFFLYDYKVFSSFRGVGTKVRSWVSGDYRYTETSYFQLEREMKAVYDNIPVDASIEMDDSVMDLMEPFAYSDLMSFEPKYLSGFFGEVYNAPATAFQPRAEEKVKESAEQLLRESYSGFTGVVTEHKEHKCAAGRVDYALLPVWVYAYNYRDKIYNFYVNGQTGKIVGRTPVSKPKLFVYGATVGAIAYAAFVLIGLIAGVL